MTIAGVTVMVPVHTAPAFESPYFIERPDVSGRSRVLRDHLLVGEIDYPSKPRFYDLTTADGTPYSKIAVLHGRDVLATTILQTCIRYKSRTKTCQFCAIGHRSQRDARSSARRRSSWRRSQPPRVALMGVKHMVMTTGTPPGTDRGAAIMTESAAAVKSAR